MNEDDPAAPKRIERRAHVRVRPRRNQPVEVQIMGVSYLEVVHARDISAGGVSIWIPHGMPEREFNRKVDLVVHLPHAPSFLVRGIVRHVRSQPGSRQFIGVQFIDLTPEREAQLDAYIEQRLAEGAQEVEWL